MAAVDPKVAALLETARDLLEKQALVIGELSALIEGEEGMGPKVKRLKAFYSGAWAERHGTPYAFANHAMVGASFKRWLVAGFSAEEIEARMTSYLLTGEAFYVQRRHPFELFVRGFNSFRGIQVAPAEAKTLADLRSQRGEP